MTALLPPPTTTPTDAVTLSGDAFLDELDRLEADAGHDLWAEAFGRPDVQRWECRRCPAVLERRLADGLVTGSARERKCADPS